jgi:rare lipoprotein A (peptidoglycan hydrolase)
LLVKKKIRSVILILNVASAVAIAVVVCFLALASAASADNSSQDISDQLAARQQYLEKNRLELSGMDSRIASSEQYLDQRRTELADATARLRDTEDRYNETLKLYEGRISAIYKLGESNFYAVALSSEDFSDAVSRVAYLSKVSENDQHLVNRVKADAEAVRQMHERVDDLKQAQVEDMSALKLRKQQLEGQIASDQAGIDKQNVELAQARAREKDEELIRTANASYDGGSIYAGVMSPSLTVSNQPPPGLRPTGIGMSGMASWYGPGFQGNTTANGEIYNMYGYTAAHKSLPFNTWLKVTHAGRSVFVRINDRGPYVAGRIIDLSLSSAQAIGISGVGFVSAEIYR